MESKTDTMTLICQQTKMLIHRRQSWYSILSLECKKKRKYGQTIMTGPVYWSEGKIMHIPNNPRFDQHGRSGTEKTAVPSPLETQMNTTATR